MDISSVLPVNAIIPHLQVRDKKQALKKLSAYAATVCPLAEKEIFAALSERENAGCTGMGKGVCIPHGRFSSLSRVYMLFAKLEEPIEFDAEDGRKVDLVFLVLSPSSSDTEHIKALATVSKLLRDKEICKKLREAENADQLYSVLISGYGENKL